MNEWAGTAGPLRAVLAELRPESIPSLMGLLNLKEVLVELVAAVARRRTFHWHGRAGAGLRADLPADTQRFDSIRLDSARPDQIRVE